MPNIRWLGLACVLGLGGLSAWAQPTGPMVCTTTTPPPPQVRTEGVAERIGDLILNCSGGTPTPAGQPVPQVNLQVYYNADVTNRLLAPSGFTDALLIVDEAGSTTNPNRLVCGTPFTGVCAITGTGTGAGVYNGSSGRPNVFQAKDNGLNSLQWIGVPIDPPGSTGIRTLRMANVRLHAHQKGPVTNPAQMLTGVVSAVGPTAPPIANPSAVLGFISNGMEFATGAAPSFKQCAPQNPALSQSPNQNGTPQVHLTFTEGFAQAYKPMTIAPYANANTSPVPVPQTVPGTQWNSESGYYDPFLMPIPGRGDLGLAGLADHGTRLLARFTGVPKFVKLFAPAVITNGQLVARMINVPASGAGNFVPKSANGFGLAQIAVNNAGDATVVYEVLRADPLAVETVAVPVYVAYATPIPSPATVLVSGAFGPLTNVFTADANAPLPRFAELSTPVTAFTIGACIAGGINGNASVPNASMQVNLACDVAAVPQSLTVNWPGNSFTLGTVNAATCSNDPLISPAPPPSVYDTLVGSGSGKWNGFPGATATWKFQDAGEPGVNKDPVQLVIKNSFGITVLTVNGKLTGGNLQAHN